ncbi:MAG TPA: cupin domain-containing protein [Candidatus Saccharimonadales bacterium]|nr:cupin domain-containing protein [Candidatus Saccharimonadales bacterium]
MKITRAVNDTNKGPAASFTGDVYIDGIRNPDGQSKVGSAAVHFTPGARAAWHTHPRGQTIYVVEGIGMAQAEGGPIEVIRPGDVVYFEPGENHWHGAAKNRFMMHIAIQEADENGVMINWGEHVTDEQYNQQPEI